MLALFIELDADVYVPLCERLEAELSDLKTREGACPAPAPIL